MDNKKRSNFWYVLLATLIIATSIATYKARTFAVATYIHHKYNQTSQYDNYHRLRGNHTFRYCTAYVYKDSNEFHVWAEFDCGAGDYFKTHVYGTRKVEAQIITTKEPGLTMFGHETISSVFPIDIINQAEFGKYHLLTNNCRSYLVLLHRILESFPYHNKKYNREPVTELLNVNIGVDYANVMSELTFKKIQQAIASVS